MSRFRLASSAAIAIVGALACQCYGAEPAITTIGASAPQLQSRTVETLMAAARQPAVSSTERDPNQVEVCGVGWFDNEAADQSGSREMKEAISRAKDQMQQGRSELVDRLMADPSGFSQAVGALVQVWGLLDDQRQSEAGEDVVSCSDSSNCPSAMAAQATMTGLADQLARMAQSTSDPRLYSLAFKTCRSSPSAAACVALSAQQWARIDPGNSAPWLYVLDEATSRNDASGVDDALFQMASATRHDDRYFSVAGEISGHVDRTDISALATYVAAIGALGVTAAHAWPLMPVAQACGTESLRDANRRQLCQRLAQMLVDRSDTMMMASIGDRIGRRLGWPEERRDAFGGLQHAFWDSTAAHGGVEMTFSCDGIRKQLHRFAQSSETGELGQVREWLATTGQSLETYTQKAREERLRTATQETLRRAADAASVANGRASAPR